MGILPSHSPLKPQSSVQHLRDRLQWGEPGLTIIDARDRGQFNYQHISGAVSMPVEHIVEIAEQALETTRDIYVYAETDEEAATAANKLRQAGYKQVAELKGGIPAWKAIAGPIDDGASYADDNIPEPKLAPRFIAERAAE